MKHLDLIKKNLLRLNVVICFAVIVFNNGLIRTKVSEDISDDRRISIDLLLVCPTCRKRCWLKDVLYIDLDNCIVNYGKKKIENLSVERDRLKEEIKRLKQSIVIVGEHLRKTEYRWRDKQRFTQRLRAFSRRNFN